MGEPLLSREAKSIEHGTPPELFAELDGEFGFTLDAAASDSNALCGEYYTVEEDGRFAPWAGHTVFCNPPYRAKELSAFTAKAIAEVENGVTSVLLLPTKADQSWFHTLWGWFLRRIEGTLEEGQPDVMFRWIRGRLRYVGNPDSAGFPSMIVVIRPYRR